MSTLTRDLSVATCVLSTSRRHLVILGRDPWICFNFLIPFAARKKGTDAARRHLRGGSAYDLFAVALGKKASSEKNRTERNKGRTYGS